MDCLSLSICSTKQKQTYYCLNNFLLRQQNTILRQYKDTRIARNVRGANFHLTLFIQQFAIVLVNLFKQWKSKFFVNTVLVFVEQKRLLWTLVYEKQCTSRNTSIAWAGYKVKTYSKHLANLSEVEWKMWYPSEKVFVFTCKTK